MKKYISALPDKYRSAILIAVMLCFAFIGNAQVYQNFNQYGGTWKRLHPTIALGIPNDTFALDVDHQAYPHIVAKGDSVYIWSPISLQWKLLSTTGNAFTSCEDKRIDGGEVTYSGTGLKFYISPAIYRINCVIYTTTYDSVTLSAADPDDPRKDVIFLATTGVDVKTGTPAGPAAEPQMDIGEIKLTVIDIQAAATTPSLTTNVLWDENTEGSVVTNIGTTTNPDNTTFPFHLLKSIEFTNVNNGDAGIVTLSSTIDLSAYNSFSFFIKLKAALPTGATLSINFYNGANAVTPGVIVSFNKTSTVYQGISVSTTRFTSGASNTFIDKVRITFSGVSANQAGFYLDYLTLVSGFLQPGGGSGTPLAMAPVDSNPANPNGGTISNGLLNLNRVTNSYSGLMTPELKAKLDSLRSDYFIDNVGDGEELATQVNDSTVGIKTLKAGTNITLTGTDTTVVINATGGVNGIDDVLALQQPFTTHRKIGANGFDFTLDSANNVNLRSGLEFISSGIGSSIQMSDSVASYTSSSATDFSTIQTTPTKIKFIPFDGVGSAGDVWTNLGSGEGHWAAGGGGGGASIWNGAVIGTTFSATTSTVNNGAVQWTFTGSSPTTFTLPARTSSVNQFYTFKNLGSATLTIAAAGTDDIFTTSSVTSVAILPGESIMITGAANGTSDLWTALFHSSGTANSTGSLRIDRTYGGIQSYFIRTSDTTLVVKDIVGDSYLTASTLTDSTNKVSLTSIPVSYVIAASDETTDLTTGTAKVTFRMPHGMTVTEVRASLTTTSSSGTPTIDINEGGTTILSTKITVDVGEKTSTTAAAAPVISDATLADDAEITIDIDTAGTGAKGLKVTIKGTRTL